MGFSYNICFVSFFSDIHEDFGVHNDEGFKFRKPEIPEKFRKYMNGRWGNLDFIFFQNAVEQYDKEMILITEQFLDFLPDIEQFLNENIEKIDNIEDAKEYYQTIKELLIYLIEEEETEQNWYFSYCW